ncbi:hypothetical protein BOTBODRAFT_68018 [Botryobasidium botryosum FD-172 SS1]|uniref:ADP-ribosylhydrolase ARH3 n=1 Tax=Botryobasidium botryosum (strain FD-172 SS1) TaxID=930990 RepID=A0A067M9X1_BOTB1|nr:hypothetical protein BOTBODRAFT_68018 [Botryobasidium botryosum FD-172 SS1]
MYPTLRAQRPTPAPTDVKIRLSILATALVDALGGPPEFHSRFTFPLVTSMQPNNNFGVPPGVWTDDTSMTLCLARSIATYTPPGFTHLGGFDEKHQIEAYVAWYKKGILSAIGKCFDIGSTISRALSIYSKNIGTGGSPNDGLEQIKEKLSGDGFGGNGSLMRVLPVGLAYWRDESAARAYARRSSETTHPNALCMEACEMWTGAIVRILRHSSQREEEPEVRYSKLELGLRLRDALIISSHAPPRPSEPKALEEYFMQHHPILSLVAQIRLRPPRGVDSRPNMSTEAELPSSGYVLHTLIAALYCFFATATYEEGAILAVNLGQDADTVGAIYAGLAGCWYAAVEEKDMGGVFWSDKVKEWKADLVAKDLVEQVAEELVTFATK